MYIYIYIHTHTTALPTSNPSSQRTRVNPGAGRLFRVCVLFSSSFLASFWLSFGIPRKRSRRETIVFQLVPRAVLALSVNIAHLLGYRGYGEHPEFISIYLNLSTYLSTDLHRISYRYRFLVISYTQRAPGAYLYISKPIYVSIYR